MFRYSFALAALVFVCSTEAHAANDSSVYISARLLGSFENISGMNTSLRPGVGRYINGRETAAYPGGAFAIGERVGSFWRVEAEYAVPHSTEYTSGSSIFPTSLNHFKNKKQQVMLNLYRDIAITRSTSLYLTAGVGAAISRSSGWQGNLTRTFVPNSVLSR